MTPHEIRTARAARHRARPRDFADEHGIAEAALVAAFTGPQVVHVAADPKQLLPMAADLVVALALTRNESAVQEREGRYGPFDAERATLRSDEIELRLMPDHWVHGFAVTEPTAKATKRSIQVFDAAGDAVHKIHLTPESDLSAFGRLVEALRLPDQPETLTLHPRAPVSPGRREGTRLQPQAATLLLERAAASRAVIEIRSGNAGCLQIFSGRIERVLPAGYWINVMDPRFNLHLRTDRLADVRRIEPPDAAPLVRAFDPDGAEILTVTGGTGWPEVALSLPVVDS